MIRRCVIAVEPLAPCKLKVIFDNQETKIVDMANLLQRKNFAPLKDVELFKRVCVDSDLDTIVWEHGADICPNVLYEIGQEIIEEQAMESVNEKHAEIVKKVLSYYAQFKPSHGEIEVETVFDDIRHHYEMVHVGWDGVRKVHGSVIHVDIKPDGKIWIQHDGTESGIADDLLAAGVPKNQIVLAFYSPRKRVHTEFAVS